MLNQYLKSNGIKEQVINLAEEAEKQIVDVFKELDNIKMYNQLKVLDAMQKEKLSDAHFTFSTGYGYGDIGRDVIDKIYSRIFNTEDALVRPHIVSGTHAISLALQGVLRPGDTLMSITGTPYDTLLKVIGIKGEGYGSLKEFGINYKQVDLDDNYKIDIDEVLNQIKNDNSIKMVSMQRSTGYGWRPSLSIEDIEKAIKSIKSSRPDIICFVDNCYGEFLETKEPTDSGADLVAGSLIKNIGGGIAPTGGYIVGKKDLIELISYRLTAPGLGKDCGSTFGVVRQMLQGLFLAPHITIEALKGAVFCSKIMELAGFEVSPKFDDRRSDIIQAIKFNDEKLLIDFCKGIQKGSPVDSFVECEPWDMPGYSDPVIMAAGAFIQGSSIELSADAPIRPPYIAYVQGGLTYEHSKIGIMRALSQII